MTPQLQSTFEAMRDRAGEHRALLEWLGITAAATFIVGVVGRWVGRVGLVVVTAAAFVFAFQGATDTPVKWIGSAKPPAEGLDKLPYAVVGFAVVGLLLSFHKVPSWARFGGVIAATGVGVATALWPHAPGWSIPADRWAEVWHWSATAGVAAGVIWASTEAVAAKRPGVAPVVTIGLLAAGVGGLLANTGSARVATLAVVTTVAVFGAFAASLVTKRTEFDRGPIFVWVTTLVLLLAFGVNNTDYFGQTGDGRPSPWWPVLVLTAPLLAWVGQIKPIADRRPWARELARGIVVAGPIVTVVAIASLRSVKSQDADTSTTYVPPKVEDKNIGGWPE